MGAFPKAKNTRDPTNVQLPDVTEVQQCAASKPSTMKVLQMLMRTSLEESGDFLFRWRGIAPLVFIPWLTFSIIQGEPLEHVYGDIIGELIELIALTLMFGGLAVRTLRRRSRTSPYLRT